MAGTRNGNEMMGPEPVEASSHWTKFFLSCNRLKYSLFLYRIYSINYLNIKDYCIKREHIPTIRCLLIANLAVFPRRLALSPYPLSHTRHVHKSPLAGPRLRLTRGSFRPVGSPNGGSTPYCGYDLRNELPKITRCFLGMLAAA